MYIMSETDTNDPQTKQTMYSVQATTVLGNVMRQVPTFYLDRNVQGIIDTNMAVLIALDILTTNRAVVLDDVAVFVSDGTSSRASGPETFKLYMKTGRVTL